MAKNVLATPQGKKVTLADGNEWTLSPFNLNVLANLEETFDCGLDELTDKLKGRTASTFRKLLKVLLQENHPDLTLDDVGRLVEISAIKDLLKQITGGLKGLKVE